MCLDERRVSWGGGRGGLEMESSYTEGSGFDDL